MKRDIITFATLGSVLAGVSIGAGNTIGYSLSTGYGLSTLGLVATTILHTEGFKGFREWLATPSIPKPKKTPNLPLFFGSMGGKPVIKDLTTHLLIAGITGSGKGVLITNLICHLLKHANFEMDIIDVGVVDFQIFTKNNKVNPIISNLPTAHARLSELLDLHDERLKLLLNAEVVNINDYNKQTDKKMKQHIVVIDEFADLIGTFTGDSNKSIKQELNFMLTRISQICRKTGIHLILATQRPTVDIINGTIKTNCDRFGLKVKTDVDSRVIGIPNLHKLEHKFGYGLTEDNELIKIPKLNPKAYV